MDKRTLELSNAEQLRVLRLCLSSLIIENHAIARDLRKSDCFQMASALDAETEVAAGLLKLVNYITK